MSIRIYKDINANSIFIEDANGAQFVNTLQAIEGDGVCSIHDNVKDIDIVTELSYTEFLDENDQTYGSSATEVCNNLNVMFSSVGSAGEIPVITSPVEINVTTGDTINYELLADFGVGYEWANLPSGVVTVDGNVRKLIGVIDTPGTYTPSMKAINYFGSDTETLTINVSSPPFASTKSVKFSNFDYMNADATTLNPLYRPANGSGASDAWTISCWFKPISGPQTQTIAYFGGLIGGGITVSYIGATDRIRLTYGSFFNNLELDTPNSSITTNTWNHVIITYDGGTTGVASGSLNDYYGRFEIFINGTSQTTSNDHSNFGFNGEIEDTYFRIGRNGIGSNYLRNEARVDEFAIWSTDETANVASIYNSGVTHDLSLLGSPPDHWWRFGDGDTYPTISDNISSLDFTMVNMTVADIVNDTP